MSAAPPLCMIVCCWRKGESEGGMQVGEESGGGYRCCMSSCALRLRRTAMLWWLFSFQSRLRQATEQ
eukprot:606978-Rhodomonas_salina.1